MDAGDAIGANVKSYRLQRGLKQEELCAGICSVSQLSKIETGKAQAKPEHVAAFSKRLGVTVEQLLSADALREELEQKLKLCMRVGNISPTAQTRLLLLEVVERSQEAGYRDLYVEAVFLLSRCYEFIGDWAEVRRLIAGVLDSGQVTEPGRLMDLWGQLGVAYQNGGDMGTAYSCFAQEARYIDQIADDHPQAMRVFYRYAAHQYDLRNYREACRYAQKTLALAESTHKHVWRLRTTNMYALCLNRLGEQRELRYALLKSALQEAEDNSMLYDAGIIANNLGTLCFTDGDLAGARTYQLLSLQYGECAGDANPRSFLCEPIYELALISVRQGKRQEAEEHLARLCVLAEGITHRKFLYEARIELIRAQIAELRGNCKKQIAHLRAALAIYDQHHVYVEAGETAARLAEALEEQGERSAALELYRRSVICQQKFEAARQEKRGPAC